MIMVLGNSLDMMYIELDGSFMFDNLELGIDYSVVVQLNENFFNGVIIFDFILMSKYILGMVILDFLYKLIVVDVDCLGYIFMLDIIKFWKLILNIDNELLNNNIFWCFIDVVYEFFDFSNLFMGYFLEFFNINDLDGLEMYVDFIVIKVGDVNNLVILNSFSGGGDDCFNGILFVFKVVSVEVEVGEIIDILFMVCYMNEWMGYQFIFEFDLSVLQVEEIIFGDMLNFYFEENFYIYDECLGFIIIVWNEYGVSVSSKEFIVFMLCCIVK